MGLGDEIESRTRVIWLKSDDALINTDEGNQARFNLPAPLTADDDHVFQVGVSSLTFTNTFYNIHSDNKTLKVGSYYNGGDGGTAHNITVTITLTEGNYTATELVAHINSFVSTSLKLSLTGTEFGGTALPIPIMMKWS